MVPGTIAIILSVMVMELRSPLLLSQFTCSVPVHPVLPKCGSRQVMERKGVLSLFLFSQFFSRSVSY